jgi:hypothetical protein
LGERICNKTFKAYNCLVFWVPFLLLSGVLWNDMRFTAEVVEGYNVIAGASKLLLVDLSSLFRDGAVAFVVKKRVASCTWQLHL